MPSREHDFCIAIIRGRVDTSAQAGNVSGSTMRDAMFGLGVALAVAIATAIAVAVLVLVAEALGVSP
jgi:hypothetical protein